MQDFTKEYNINSLISVIPNGTNFKMNVTPRFLNHYERKDYEKFTSLIVRNFAKKSDYFIDVGAHYGYFSLLVNESNKDIKIKAIEPIKENHDILSLNLSLITKKENIINLAISNEKGEKEFHKSMASDNCGFLEHPNAETIEKIVVNVNTLDNLFYEKLAGSVLIKVDTEGNELDVLKGMDKLFETILDIKLILEINPKMLKLAQSSPEIIFEFLKERNFSIYLIDDERSNLLKLDSLDWEKEFLDYSYFNILAIRKEIEKNICFFAHSSQLGGAERSLLDLVEIFISNGIICSVVMAGEGPLKNRMESLGVSVLSVDSMAWWCNSGDNNTCKQDIIKTIKNDLPNILEFVRKISPDVIYSQTIVNPFGAIVAEELNLPHFYSIREYGEKDHNLKFCFGFEDSIRALSATSDSIFSISNSTKDVVLTDIDSKKKCKVNYSKVNLQKDFILSKYKIIDKELIKIGIFGSIVDGKNQEDGIQAVIKLLDRGYNIELYLVGHYNQEYFEYLGEIIKNTPYSNKIKFMNYSDEILRLMNEMNIVLSCSKEEALGRTLIEAILLKIPIVFTNSGGPKEIYKNGIHGLSYTVGKIDELIQQITSTIDKENETKRRVEESYEYVKNFFNDEKYAQPIIDSLIIVKKGRKERKEKYITNFIISNFVIKDFIYLEKIKTTDNFFIQLFIEDENGLSEENSIKLPVLQNNEIQKFEFDLKDKKNIQNLRLDPLNDSCVIEIQSIKIVTNNEENELIECISSNSIINHGKNYFFDIEDPNIYFEGTDADTFQNTDKLIVAIRFVHIGKDALHVSVKQTKTELDQTKTELDQTKTELENIYISKSWKITKPLRSIFEITRKLIKVK